MSLTLCAALLVSSLTLATEPAPETTARVPSALEVSQLPVLADRMRAQQVNEAELRALLETALGSGVSVQALVGALEVVVQELEAGAELPDLALRLPGLIVQGFEGDALASMLGQVGQAASASVAVGASPMPVPVEQPEEPVSDE